MATDRVNHPLLSGLLDPSSPRRNISTRRRFRRCKSAPRGDHAPEITGDNSPPNQDSIPKALRPGLRNIALFLVMYICIGALWFYLLRTQILGKKTNAFIDAAYFCVVTMTTVGYGDVVPNSKATKLLASGYVFVGMALIGVVLGKAADYLVEKQEVFLVKALHLRDKVGPYELLKELETNKPKYKCIVAFILLVFLMSVGTVFLVFAEDMSFVNAFYCVCATVTTLGYGDTSFRTEWGRVFAIFWILMSCVCLAQLLLYLAELYAENKQRSIAKLVLSRRMTNVDLEAADLDNDKIVVAAEFVIYKLKEMGKISQEDISVIMDEFEELDVDQWGSLSCMILRSLNHLDHGGSYYHEKVIG